MDWIYKRVSYTSVRRSILMILLKIFTLYKSKHCSSIWLLNALRKTSHCRTQILVSISRICLCRNDLQDNKNKVSTWTMDFVSGFIVFVVILLFSYSSYTLLFSFSSSLSSSWTSIWSAKLLDTSPSNCSLVSSFFSSKSFKFIFFVILLSPLYISALKCGICFLHTTCSFSNSLYCKVQSFSSFTSFIQL